MNSRENLHIFYCILLLILIMNTTQGVDLTLDSSAFCSCAEDNAFHCEDDQKHCVPKEIVCDGAVHCHNGKDESVEICGCLPTEFQCNATTCIDIIQRCDTRMDCENGIDELNCETYTCPLTTHVTCDNHFCVPRGQLCDFANDCGDNSDEKGCTRRPCYDTEFQCNNSQCVPMASLCDRISDCVDASDEDINECEKHFKCPIGFYISDVHRCDGWNDCLFSNSDEIDCGECEAYQYRCPNTQCINNSNVCDGYCDCISCADEDNCDTNGCPTETKLMCHPYQKRSPRCILQENVCDGQNDCRDSRSGLDEHFCLLQKDCYEKHQDDEGYFYCQEGRCIPEILLCDHYTDCFNGEDEKGCNFSACAETEFKCDNGQCVSMVGRCDTIRDCNDWSDEVDCDTVECPPHTKRCRSGQCLTEEFWCDFTRDCPDGSDEFKCDIRECIDGEFRCNNGQCIDASLLCYYDRDQIRLGCNDSSHLFNCADHVCRPGEHKCGISYCVNESRICDMVVDCKQSQSDEDGCEYPCPVSIKTCDCKKEEMNCDNLNLLEVPKLQEQEHFSILRFSGNRLNITNSTFSMNYYDKVTYIDLSNNSLTEIPVQLFNTMWQLTYLNLGDNDISALKNGTLLRLSRLKQLHLKGNKIHTIEVDAFVALLNLTALDLSGQRLTHLYKNMFKGLKKITMLNLSGNMIHSIENGAFNNLVNVISIDLTNNQIKDIGENVFLGLPRLTKLKTDSYRFCCLAQPGVDCLPKPDEFSSCEDLMSNHVLRVSIWVLGITALCGNFIVIIWRVRDFRGGKVHSFLITNLAIGDFLMGVYLLIIAAVDTHYRGMYIIHDEDWRHSGLCKFAGFVSTFSSELSVLTLTTITLDRLICILFPLKRTRLSLRQAGIVMSLIWGFVFLLAMLPLVGISYFEGFYGRSGVCLALHVTPERPPGWEYSVGVFLVLNFTSFLLITFSYLWMFSVAKKTRSAVRTAESKTDNAMARRMTLIVMTDFCCWVPIIVLGFVSLAGARADEQVYAWIAVFVLPLNSATNPVIYTLSTAPFLGNIRKRANRFRKSFIHSFTAETKHSYVDDRTSHSYCERKSPYRQLELIRLRSLNSSPPPYYNRDLPSDS